MALNREKILQKSLGIDDSGHLVWQLVVGLIVAWIIIWAMVIKGIKVGITFFSNLGLKHLNLNPID